MYSKKRQMMLLPEINPRSFVFFFERGDSGRSWSIRDYSIENRLKEYRPTDYPWTADEIHQRARHSFDAPTHPTQDLAFWHRHTLECNRRIPGATTSAPPAQVPTVVPAPPPAAVRNAAFPVLNLPQLLELPKGRKPQDMDRILHSANSEDWVTWNFFQLLRMQYPNDWWARLLTVARRRNPDLLFACDTALPPAARFWLSARSPVEYENQSRSRMLASGNPDWVSRARIADPVEGPSEIDVVFEQDRFLVYAEAKLGSDVSMRTTYDPRRNQIIRNIDCLIGNAGGRMPLFWMFVRDQSPERSYVQLMNSYKADPELLLRDLPHRNPELLRGLARNLTILQWNDFRELSAGPPVIDPLQTAVRQELGRRIDAPSR
jgi:hypothetical protein